MHQPAMLPQGRLYLLNLKWEVRVRVSFWYRGMLSSFIWKGIGVKFVVEIFSFSFWNATPGWQFLVSSQESSFQHPNTECNMTVSCHCKPPQSSCSMGQHGDQMWQCGESTGKALFEQRDILSPYFIITSVFHCELEDLIILMILNCTYIHLV